MYSRALISVFLLVWCTSIHAVILPSTSRQPLPPSLDVEVNKDLLEDTPEGYYAFIQSPNVEPPQVRPPPYFKSETICPGVTHASSGKSMFNLCGDLNKGFIPLNPMKQNVLGSPYPFDLLKNKTLEFFSKALPILQADDTLPKVAKYQTESHQYYKYESNQPSKQWDHRDEPTLHRIKRDDRFQQSLNVLRGILTGQEDVINSTKRIARKFCERGGGVLCMLYRAIQGEPLATGIVERRDDDVAELRSPESNSLLQDGPPTPCPAKVEYATPVFARNYQGIWRYVVQIPYEGYFTQTIEITRCMQSKCYYMEGGCLSSPRWVSLLVAEIFYPESFLPTNRKPSAPRTPVQGEDPPMGNYNQYLHREGEPAESESRSIQSSKPSHCDGVDKLGCFQVRLYYDWFLVPGSCKCWRPDYFSKYVRRKNFGSEL